MPWVPAHQKLTAFAEVAVRVVTVKDRALRLRLFVACCSCSSLQRSSSLQASRVGSPVAVGIRAYFRDSLRARTCINTFTYTISDEVFLLACSDWELSQKTNRTHFDICTSSAEELVPLPLRPGQVGHTQVR